MSDPVFIKMTKWMGHSMPAGVGHDSMLTAADIREYLQKANVDFTDAQVQNIFALMTTAQGFNSMQLILSRHRERVEALTGIKPMFGGDGKNVKEYQKAMAPHLQWEFMIETEHAYVFQYDRRPTYTGNWAVLRASAAGFETVKDQAVRTLTTEWIARDLGKRATDETEGGTTKTALTAEETKILEALSGSLDPGEEEPDEQGVRTKVDGLPPNVESGFGGVDATQPLYSRQGFRPGLFAFDVTKADAPVSYQCGTADGTMTTYKVPKWFNLTWSSLTTGFSVAGESKRTFSKELTSKIGAGGDFFGFGGEFTRTFDEESTEETFKKYVARYDQSILYKISLSGVEDPSKYLSENAERAFANWSDAKIVDTFGTHYMSEAEFGGVRIYSSTLDVRDTVDTSILKDVLTMKIAIPNPETGGKAGKAEAETSERTKTVQKVSEKMDVIRSLTIGGLAVNSDEDLPKWQKSLYTNPTTVRYKIRPIYELINNLDKRESVKKLVNARIAQASPKDSCSLLATYAPLKIHMTDARSGAKHDFSAACPVLPPGWLRLAQYGQPLPYEDAFKGKHQGLIVRACPEHTQPNSRGVVAANSLQLHWFHMTMHGFVGQFSTPTFKMPAHDPSLGNDNNALPSGKYIFIGDVFESNEVPPNQIASLACIHEDLLVDLHPGVDTTEAATWLWDDSGTGARDDITIAGLPMSRGEANAASEPSLLIADKSDSHTPMVFKSFPPDEIDWKTLKGRTLKWSKVKLVQPNWLFDQF